MNYKKTKERNRKRWRTKRCVSLARKWLSVPLAVHKSLSVLKGKTFNEVLKTLFGIN